MAAPRSDTGDLLLQAARAMRARWRQELTGSDISPHQARALGVVCAQAGMRPSDVAARLRIAPRSATEVIDALEDLGLLQRSPSPNDRRAVILEPTEAGRRYHAEIHRARDQVTEDFLARLDPASRARLDELLLRLLED